MNNGYDEIAVLLFLHNLKYDCALEENIIYVGNFSN